MQTTWHLKLGKEISKAQPAISSRSEECYNCLFLVEAFLVYLLN